MKDNVISEVSNILNSFDDSEISRIIKDQINSDYANDPSTEILTDHYRPLYVTYSKIMNSEMSTEIKNEVESHFIDICKLFIQAICDKFHLSLSEDWIEDNYKNIPAITMALYYFFVIDLYGNVQGVLSNFISRNAKEIYKTFEGMRNKKDASTLVNKKFLSPEFTLIISNIYDITHWILQQLEDDDFIKYMDQSYLPLTVIRQLFENGYIAGGFVEVICDIFTYSVNFKSNIGFGIISKVRIGEISDPFERSNDEE